MLFSLFLSQTTRYQIPYILELTHTYCTDMLDSPWEELLHYGLLVGAVIQLVAIAAIFVLPSSQDDEQETSDEGRGAEHADTKPPTAPVSSNKKGRKDKAAARRRR